LKVTRLLKVGALVELRLRGTLVRRLQSPSGFAHEEAQHCKTDGAPRTSPVGCDAARSNLPRPAHESHDELIVSIVSRQLVEQDPFP
jgi:hypothetical protein